jgi:nicotinamide mononucleotide transporter
LSLAARVVEALAAVPAIEWAAAALALGYLVLAIRQNAGCWFFAVASALLYLVVFARAGLVMQAALQVFYVGVAFYGWRAWRGTGQQAPVSIRRWSTGQHALALTGVAGISFANGALIAHDAAGAWLPYVDAAIAWGSVLTTWMVARKILDNWLYWIVIDAAMTVLAVRQGLTATGLLFALYTVLAIFGFWRWRHDLTATPVRLA